MSKSESTAQEGQTQESLADEIRSSEGLYVEAAVAEFRRIAEMEYYRLRAYAIEGGTTQINLRVNVCFNFAPTARSVSISSVPDFAPAAQTRTVTIKP